MTPTPPLSPQLLKTSSRFSGEVTGLSRSARTGSVLAIKAAFVRIVNLWPVPLQRAADIFVTRWRLISHRGNQGGLPLSDVLMERDQLIKIDCFCLLVWDLLPDLKQMVGK